jgi:hypothetical protein
MGSWSSRLSAAIRDFHFNGAGVFSTSAAHHDKLNLQGFGLANIAGLLSLTTFDVNATTGVVSSTISDAAGDNIRLDTANVAAFLSDGGHNGDIIF